MILQVIFSKNVGGQEFANLKLKQEVLKSKKIFLAYLLEQWENKHAFFIPDDKKWSVVNSKQTNPDGAPRYMDTPSLAKISCCIYGMEEGKVPYPSWYKKIHGKFYFNEDSKPR